MTSKGTTVRSEGIFDIDVSGFRQTLKRRGDHWGAFVLAELLQNSIDEDGVNEVKIDFTFEGRAATIRVEDDAPEGFQDLSLAYTLFAPSTKRDDPTKRGIFCIGEKMVIALCKTAKITTTKGCVEFDVAKGHRDKRRKRTERGSVFEGVIPMLRAEYDAAVDYMKSIIPPRDIDIYFNGEVLECREPYKIVAVNALPTVIGGEDGNLKRTARNTTVELHEVREGEIPHLYEMGIPVMEIPDDEYHYDVQQRVPVNFERNSVPPAFLKKIRPVVLNAVHKTVVPGKARALWVTDALESGQSEPEVVRDIAKKRLGDKAVKRSLQDSEANNKAIAAGYNVVHGRQETKAVWSAIKQAEEVLEETFIPVAHDVTPSHLSWKPEAAPSLPEDKKTDDMSRVRAYMERVASALVGEVVEVRLVDHPSASYVAAYSRRHLSLNVPKLEKKFFSSPTPGVEVDKLLIHELGHHYSENHLSSDYHEALCLLGAKLAEIYRENPGVLG